jgi:hypothetical protein
VLASLPSRTSTLEVTAARGPIEIIHLPSGVTVADAPSRARGLRIALPPGRYLVRTIAAEGVYAKEVEVRPGETVTLTDGQLEALGSQWLAVKGDEGAPQPLRGAVVHIEGGHDVVLERSEGDGPWTRACSAPCDQELPLDSMYRIGGSGVRLSEPFQLAARPGGRVSLRVDAASRLRFTGGFVLGGAGINAMGIGAMILLNKSLEAQGYGPATDSGPSKTAGQITLAAGAAALLAGVLLVATNSSSKFVQAAPVPPHDGWLPRPTWHEAATGPGTATPATSFPLLHVAF